MDAAIVDLNLGKGTNPMTSYVAISRVKCRGDILIFRPFEKHLFRRGPARAPSALMAHLRGQVLPPETRMCTACGKRHVQEDCKPGQWHAKVERTCKKCFVAEKAKKSKPDL